MEIPDAFVRWRERLEDGGVSFGCGGIQLVEPRDLDAYQVGYSRTPEGRSLVGGKGQWQPSWIAIGSETAMGDPIILDARTLRVLTAPHGEDTWEASPIADSPAGFGVALDVIRRLSAGRENPVMLEDNPLTSIERRTALVEILEANPGINPDFWEVFLDG